ncbi:hypothetical protein JX266_004479 [Neoarthrinium moseri]|nr:hypothetical protein JX266_004479 [Neoarthrinium moseri]
MPPHQFSIGSSLWEWDSQQPHNRTNWNWDARVILGLHTRPSPAEIAEAYSQAKAFLASRAASSGSEEEREAHQYDLKIIEDAHGFLRSAGSHLQSLPPQLAHRRPDPVSGLMFRLPPDRRRPVKHNSSNRRSSASASVSRKTVDDCLNTITDGSSKDKTREYLLWFLRCDPGFSVGHSFRPLDALPFTSKALQKFHRQKSQTFERQQSSYDSRELKRRPSELRRKASRAQLYRQPSQLGRRRSSRTSLGSQTSTRHSTGSQFSDSSISGVSETLEAITEMVREWKDALKSPGLFLSGRRRSSTVQVLRPPIDRLAQTIQHYRILNKAASSPIEYSYEQTKRLIKLHDDMRISNKVFTQLKSKGGTVDHHLLDDVLYAEYDVNWSG